jgi:hypothetical protein
MLHFGLMRFFQLVFTGLLAFAVFTLSDTRKHFFLAMALGLPTMLLQLVTFARPNREMLFVSTVFALLFISLVLVAIYTTVFKKGRVDSEKLAGAVCVYLLIGLAFSLLYTLVAVVTPNAFSVTSNIQDRFQDPASSLHTIEAAFIYFSFVTLTTLGYGDISPVSPMAQTIAWIEAVVGQLFIGVTIARLVGLATMRKD